MAQPIPPWRLVVAYGLYAVLALSIYQIEYRNDWSHFPAVLLGVTACWLLVDLLQTGFEVSTQRPRQWLQNRRWVWMSVSGVALVVVLGLMAADAARFGFTPPSRVALDVAVGVGAAFVRYLFRIRFSHQG